MNTAVAVLPTDQQANSDTTRRRLTSVGRYMTFGFLSLFLLFGGIGGWAAFTDLAGAVIAPGTVVVASNVKKIQHPTGGVIGEIHVKNGDEVKPGDLLVKLDETITRANLQLITKQIDELSGRMSRLHAERDDAPKVTFPDDLIDRKAEPAVAQIVAGEQTLFEKRVSSRRSQIAQLGERISALTEQIQGLEAQVKAKGKEIELIGKELSSLETLEDRKLVTTSKMMALRREAARLEGERAQLQAAIGESKGRIAEIEIQRLGVESDAKGETLKDLRETEGKLAELEERKTAAVDQLTRVEVRSPVEGVVHQLAVNTIGGVISNTEPMMLIVPKGEKLIVEAHVAPQDVDEARAHDTASVRLTAFNRNTTPQVNGRVINVSADITHDQRTGVGYFIARIEIPETEMSRLGALKLLPGMPAEVQIKTSNRKAWSYLLRPIEEQFSRAFKEN